MRTVKTAAPNGSVAGLLGEAAVAITVGLGEGGRSLGEDLGEGLEDFFVIGASKVGKSRRRSEALGVGVDLENGLPGIRPKFVNLSCPSLVSFSYVC